MFKIEHNCKQMSPTLFFFPQNFEWSFAQLLLSFANKTSNLSFDPRNCFCLVNVNTRFKNSSKENVALCHKSSVAHFQKVRPKHSASPKTSKRVASACRRTRSSLKIIFFKNRPLLLSCAASNKLGVSNSLFVWVHLNLVNNWMQIFIKNSLRASISADWHSRCPSRRFQKTD